MRSIDLGIAVIHLDVAGARLRRWWMRHRTWLVGGTVLLLLLGGSVLVTRMQAQGSVRVVAMARRPGSPGPALAVRLDGVPLAPVGEAWVWHGPAGRYLLTIDAPGHYPHAQVVTVTTGMTTTVVAAVGVPRPTVHRVPPPVPGGRWGVITAATPERWHALMYPAPAAAAAADGGASFWPRAAERSDARPLVVQIDGGVARRLTLRDRYPAADERWDRSAPADRPGPTGAAGQRWWAVWVRQRDGAAGGGAHGAIQIVLPDGRALTGAAPGEVDGLWWAPHGRWLVMALRDDVGSHVRIWDAQSDTMPLDAPLVATMPGPVVGVEWSPDGQSAVLLAAAAAGPAGAHDALLIGRVGEGWQAVALPVPPVRPGGLVPFGWREHGVLWVDADGMLSYWPGVDRAPIPLGALPSGVLAVTVADATDALLLAVQRTDGQIALQWWPDGEEVAVLDEVPPGAPGEVGGRWRGTTLVLVVDETLWYLVYPPAVLTRGAEEGRIAE